MQLQWVLLEFMYSMRLILRYKMLMVTKTLLWPKMLILVFSRMCGEEIQEAKVWLNKFDIIYYDTKQCVLILLS